MKGMGGKMADQPDIDVIEKTDTDEEIKEPSMYKVILLNDDYTPMDFVVMILMHIFNKSGEEATMIMLSVHKSGSGVAGVYSKDVAETKSALVQSLGREAGFPLATTIEEE